jgi:hypothetical protein
LSERHVLEQARERMGSSTLDLDDIYRRRARRQIERRMAAAVTALVIVVTGSVLLARTLQAAPVKVPVGTGIPSAAGGAPIDVTPALAPWVELRAVASSDAGYVAVGATSAGAGDVPIGDATDPVWFSSDGTSWARAPRDTGPDSPSLWSVTGGREGFVAVGLDRSGTPAAWTSSDGLVWARARVDLPTGIREADAMLGVLHVDGGLLAWGTVHGGDGYVWRSTDGRSWQPVADESVFGGQGHQLIQAIGVAPDGSLVALGTQGPMGSTETGSPAAWTSVDGTTWQRVDPLSAERLDELRTTTTVRDVTVTTGSTGTVSIDSPMIGGWESSITFSPSA